jgi:hypothetical protein
MGRISKLEDHRGNSMQSFMDPSRSRRYSLPPLLSLSYRIDGVFTILSMYHSSNLINPPPTLLDLHPSLLQPVSRVSLIMTLTAMSTKQDMKLKKSLEAHIARDGNGFYIWSSGRGIRKKQIGLRNLMRTSMTRDC